MKKTLVITYYWPPAGGPGVQRWLKFVKFLPEFGVEPIVYVPSNPSYPLQDDSLIHDIPKNLTIIKQPIWEPYAWANKLTKTNKDHSAGFYQTKEKQNWKTRLSLFIRGNFFIPDARKFWIQPSVQFLEKYLTEHSIDSIVTSGPPHSMHLIGLQLKKKMPQLHWIADFRDPWTNIYYYQSLKLTSWADKKHHNLEKKVLQTADTILTVTHDYCKNYQQLTSKPVYCLTNGFDPDDTLSNSTLDAKFSLAYIGAMFRERNPQILWEVLAELVSEIDTLSDDLQITFVGKYDESVSQDWNKYNLTPYIIDKGYQTHKQAIVAQNQSQVLIMVNTDHPEKRGNIPGKIFEYIAAKRPIIAFGPADSQIEKILVEAQAGQHFLFTEKQALKNHLTQLYTLYKENNLFTNTQNLAPYNRRNISETLAKIIKKQSI